MYIENNKKFYSTIIIGAGPAGLSCGIYLAAHGYDCLILEKKSKLIGKVCGDGLSRYCVSILKSIGISPDDVLAAGGKIIKRAYISSEGEEKEDIFKDGEYGIGISRDVFDGLLYDRALKQNCSIINGVCVDKIVKNDGLYIVNNHYVSNEVVLAVGANSVFIHDAVNAKMLPIGLSARIKGECSLRSDTFYTWHREKYGIGYAWVFPVGENLWNVGVWSADKKVGLKKTYYEFEKVAKEQMFSGDIAYERKPCGALMGCLKHSIVDSIDLNRIGDCAFKADFYSGEGISYAIKSGVEKAKEIILKDEA